MWYWLLVLAMCSFLTGASIMKATLKGGIDYQVGVEANKLIAECERTLPRDQVCKLQAVPAKTDEVL